jgi:hypothetical protein
LDPEWDSAAEAAEKLCCVWSAGMTKQGACGAAVARQLAQESRA